MSMHWIEGGGRPEHTVYGGQNLNTQDGKRGGLWTYRNE